MLFGNEVLAHFHRIFVLGPSLKVGTEYAYLL